MRLAILALLLGLAATGCGNTSGVETPAAAPTPTPPTCTGTTPVALTVKNYLAWCSVSVGSQPSSSAAIQTVCAAPGTVALSATALSGFELGLWHHTDADHGTGDPGTVSSGASATAVTVSGSSGTGACVWVCCPFVGGTGCPAADQCP